MYFTNWHGRVTQEDISLLYVINHIFESLSKALQKQRSLKPHCNISLNCHSITRFIAHGIPDLKVVTGSYFGVFPQEAGARSLKCDYCPHSWLVTPDGAILDPYPVGILATESAVLVSTKEEYWNFGASFYFRDGGRQEEREKGRKQAQSIIRFFRKYVNVETGEPI
jgi:hypothetical protein